MTDRGRYDSAMFWIAFGTAAAVIGLALMTIGVTRSAPGDNLLMSRWFGGGLGLLVIGTLLLLWALWLFLVHRRAEAKSKSIGGLQSGSQTASENPEVEVIRGYYREREKLMEMWDSHERNRDPKK
jgi:type VI protein secretion system component VasK